MSNEKAMSLTQLRISILDLKERMPVMLEYVKLEAKIRRERYLFLVEEGFTKQEALELVKGPLA